MAVAAIDQGWKSHLRSKRDKIHTGQVMLSLILASSMTTIPCLQAKASESDGPKVTAISVLIPCDGNGHVLLDEAAGRLPTDMPAEVKAQILHVLSKTTATNGQTIVASGAETAVEGNYGTVAAAAIPPQLTGQIEAAVAKATSAAQQKLKTLQATTSSGPGTNVVLPFLAWIILVILVIAGISSLLYLLYLFAKYFIPGNRAAINVSWSPTSTLTVANKAQIIDGSPTMTFVASSSPNAGSLGCSIQASPDLSGESWNTDFSASVGEMKFNTQEKTVTVTVTCSSPGLANQAITATVPIQPADDPNNTPTLVGSVLVNYPGAVPQFFKSTPTE